ncbi:MAG: glutamate racemase [Chitinophagaceae bacterium]
MQNNDNGAIGVFDSGYGGLVILKDFLNYLPTYDYIYIGDNARNPYGQKSMETVYQYTIEGVKAFLEMHCPLIIIACNTASAKALSKIQQTFLPTLKNPPKVLGIIRPTTEIIDSVTTTKHIGILATKGTVDSQSYILEIKEKFPHIKVYQEACPIWVEIVENDEINSEGTDYFIKKHITQLLRQNLNIDTIILGCTHYPFLIHKIRKFLPSHIHIITQGAIVAKSLQEYLELHQHIKSLLTTHQTQALFTTEDPTHFNILASRFLERTVVSKKILLG